MAVTYALDNQSLFEQRHTLLVSVSTLPLPGIAILSLDVSYAF